MSVDKLDPHFLSDREERRPALLDERAAALQTIVRKLGQLAPSPSLTEEITAWNEIISGVCAGMSHRMIHQVMLRVAIAIHHGKLDKSD